MFKPGVSTIRPQRCCQRHFLIPTRRNNDICDVCVCVCGALGVVAHCVGEAVRSGRLRFDASMLSPACLTVKYTIHALSLYVFCAACLVPSMMVTILESARRAPLVQPAVGKHTCSHTHMPTACGLDVLKQGISRRGMRSKRDCSTDVFQ